MSVPSLCELVYFNKDARLASRLVYESADHILSHAADLMARLDDTTGVRADRWREIGITRHINITVCHSVMSPVSTLQTVQLPSHYTLLVLQSLVLIEILK